MDGSLECKSPREEAVGVGSGLVGLHVQGLALGVSVLSEGTIQPWEPSLSGVSKAQM